MKYFILLAFSLLSSNFLLSQELMPVDYQIDSPYQYSYLGSNLGELGDVNGDGYTDLYSNLGAGSTWIFYGNDKFNYVPGTTINYSPNLTHGDLNNDGYEDVIFGKYSSNEIAIFYGKPEGLSVIPDQVYKAAEGTGDFGFSLDARGDMNNDGYDDLIVGQPKLTRYAGVYGKAVLFLGTQTGIKTAPDFEFTSIVGTLGYGSIVRYAGDLNHDSYDDLLVSALPIQGIQAYSSIFTQIYTGKASGMPTSQTFFSISSGEIYEMGKAGDVNNDGYDDIVLTTKNENDYAREVTVYGGGTSQVVNNKLFYKKGGFSGVAVGIGDFNGDSFDDIAISDPSYQYQYITNQGRIDVYIGQPSGIKNTSDFYYHGGPIGANIGTITFVGDLDKDGFSDIFLGYPNYLSGQYYYHAGRILLFKGRTTLKNNFSLTRKISCKNFATAFTNLSSPDAKYFQWDFGDGSSSSLKSPSHVYNSEGKFYITLTVKDESGHFKTKRDSITVYPLLSTGKYVLGGVSPDFKTLSDVNKAIQCGVDGPVEINVTPGLYQGILEIDSLDLYNKSSKYSFSFRAAPDNISEVILEDIKIYSSSNILIKGITLMDTLDFNYDNSENVVIKKSSNVIIDSCSVFNSNLNRYNGIVLDSSDNISIVKSKFKIKGNINAYFTAVKGNGNNNVLVGNNIIHLPRINYSTGNAIKFSGDKNVIIEGNEIHGDLNKRSENGIFLEKINGVSVNKNKIYSVNYALVLKECIGSEELHSIVNNAIGNDIGIANEYYPGYGVQFEKSKNLNFLHNSVSIGLNFDSLRSCFGLMCVSSESIKVMNNLFNAPRSYTYCFYFDNTSKYIDSDYNLFNGFVSSYTDLNKWRESSNMDYNSIQDKIGFASYNNLLPVNNASAINEAALTFPEVLTDINSVRRGNVTTDIGAYEISADTSNYAGYGNIGITEIKNDSLKIGENIIRLKITNYNRLVIDDILFSYEIEGEKPVVERWTGLLKFKDTLEFSFSSPYNVSRGKVYDIVCKAVINGKVGERDSLNNRFFKELYCPMEGSYTVYGLAPDFSDIYTANYNLGKCGTTSKVTFLIRPGKHDDTLNVETGPVEYRGETGDARDVEIIFGMSYNKKNITVKHISLSLIPEYPGILHEFGGTSIYGCDNLLIDSCRFYSAFESSSYYENLPWGLNVEGMSNNVRITNSSFKNFYFGVSYTNSSLYGSYFLGNQEISGCTFDGVLYPVVPLSYQLGTDSVIINKNQMKHARTPIYSQKTLLNINNIRISNNIMDSCQSFGIYFDNAVTKHIDIYNNNIVSLGGKGVLINNLEDSRICNNMITSFRDYALYISKIDATDIYNNSLYGGTLALGKYRFMNNSCYTDSMLVLSTSGSEYIGHHNNFFRKDGKALVFYISKNYKNIDSLTLETGIEKYSISTDPLYVSKSDLHSMSPKLKSRAIPVAGLVSDYDGQPRNAKTPDIGADEIDLVAYNTTPLITKLFPLDDSKDVSVNSPIQLEFDRKVLIGDAKIEIHDYEDNSIVKVVDVSEIYLADTNIIKISFKKPLKKGKDYYITVGEGTFYSFGMGNAEVHDKDYFNFTTETTSPDVITKSISGITSSGAEVSCEVIDEGGLPVLEKGIIVGKTGSSKYEYLVKSSDVGLGSYSCTLSELAQFTSYWVKAYAVNAIDTSFSDGKVFTTLPKVINGISNINEIKVLIYPNPVDESIYIDLKEKLNGEIIIYNQIGVEVARKQFNGGPVDMSGFPSGAYILRLQIKENIYHWSFIKL